jgi:hypothetical protein
LAEPDAGFRKPFGPTGGRTGVRASVGGVPHHPYARGWVGGRVTRIGGEVGWHRQRHSLPARKRAGEAVVQPVETGRHPGLLDVVPVEAEIMY